MPQDTLYTHLDTFFSGNKMLSYKQRSIILCANDTAVNVFYIETGYIRVYRISEQGEELTLNILKPHDLFPITYGMTNKTNMYYLETLTPVKIWRAPREEFVRFIRGKPDVYQELTNKALIRFDGVMSRIEYLVFSNAYTKVVSTLLICAKRFGEKLHTSDIFIRVPLTHKDIATLIGITRETTSLEMKKLEKQGYIIKSGKHIIIKNIAKLESHMLFPIDSESLLSYSL